MGQGLARPAAGVQGQAWGGVRGLGQVLWGRAQPDPAPRAGVGFGRQKLGSASPNWDRVSAGPREALRDGVGIQGWDGQCPGKEDGDG